MKSKTVIKALAVVALLVGALWVADNVLFEFFTLKSETQDYAAQLQQAEWEIERLREALDRVPERMGEVFGCGKSVERFLDSVGSTAAAFGEQQVWGISWALGLVCEWLASIR